MNSDTGGHLRCAQHLHFGTSIPKARDHDFERHRSRSAAAPQAAAEPTFANVRKCGGAPKRRSVWLRPAESCPHPVFAVPAAAARRLGVLGGALLEEISVLDAIENLDEPRQRMRLELVEPDRLGC